MAKANSRRAFLRGSGTVLAGTVMAPLLPTLGSRGEDDSHRAALSDIIPDVLGEDQANAVFGALVRRDGHQLQLQRKISGPITVVVRPETRYWRDQFTTIDVLEPGDKLLAWGDPDWRGQSDYRASTVVATPQYLVVNVTHSSRSSIDGTGLQVDLTRLGKPISSGPVTFLPGAPSIEPIEPAAIRVGNGILILGRELQKTSFRADRIGRIV